MRRLIIATTAITLVLQAAPERVPASEARHVDGNIYVSETIGSISGVAPPRPAGVVPARALWPEHFPNLLPAHAIQSQGGATQTMGASLDEPVEVDPSEYSGVEDDGPIDEWADLTPQEKQAAINRALAVEEEPGFEYGGAEFEAEDDGPIDEWIELTLAEKKASVDEMLRLDPKARRSPPMSGPTSVPQSSGRVSTRRSPSMTTTILSVR